VQLWISETFLEWTPFIETYRTRPSSEWRRPYEHWQHAEILLSGQASEFHRIDIVTTLKRAVDLRLKALNDTYSFGHIPLEMPPDRLGELSYLGIIRPLLIGQLIEMRNRIEHQDVEPPTMAYCSQLVDVVWYFLRSTEGLLRQVILDAMLDRSGGNRDEHHHVRLRWEPPKDMALRIEGWLPFQWVQEQRRDSWIEVSAEEYSRASEHFTNPVPSDDRTLEEARKRHERRDPRDVYLRGGLGGSTETLRRVYQVMFGV
jgi:hypothetical protein